MAAKVCGVRLLLDTDALIKQLIPHRKEYCSSLIEHVTVKTFGVRLLSCLSKLILHGFPSNISKGYFKLK